MSDALERIKNKVRNSNAASVHTQLIDTRNDNKNVNEHVDEYVNVSVNENGNGNGNGSDKKREKRKKFEDLYKRDTFWIRNDLKERLDGYCKGERGEKTRIINEALQQYLKGI